MLVECGFVRAQVYEGSVLREWTFRPSLARIASLGTPAEIVEVFAALHGPAAVRAAMYVLAVLCEQDDPFPLIGFIGLADGGPPDEARKLERTPGLMPAAEMVILAQHLMHHGLVGEAKPGGRGAEQGKYSAEFNAAEFVSLARVHLGMSSADAESMSMTELQQMLAMKFPQQDDNGQPVRNVPTRDEYDAQMRLIMERRNG